MGGHRWDGGCPDLRGWDRGGTITGVSDIIKRRRPGFKAIAVEPKGSPILSGGLPGPHNIPGIGAGFVAEILNKELMWYLIRGIGVGSPGGGQKARVCRKDYCIGAVDG